MQLNDVPTKNPVAASRTYEGEGVIIHSGSMELNVVNPVGTRVWELVNGERTVSAIVEEVCREFDVDEDQAREDVLEFLAELEKKDLVRLNGGE